MTHGKRKAGRLAKGESERDGVPAARVRKPAVPGCLVEAGALLERLRGEGEDGRSLAHADVEGVRLLDDDLSGLELTESLVRSSVFPGCVFEKAEFVDVVFEGCDFSNASFERAYLRRCSFVSCKFVGSLLRESTLQDVSVRECAFLYAGLNRARLRDVAVDECDFSQADLSEMSMKRCSFERTSLRDASLFRTSLDGLDLRTCDLSGVVLSEGMSELRGCMLDVLQAAGIARRLGVVVDF